jgi:hypothetical protein
VSLKHRVAWSGNKLSCDIQSQLSSRVRPSVAEIPDKTLIVISPAVSCPGFVKARIYQIYQQTLRGARNMHEIPNLPFPSLHETEQTTTQQAGAQQPEPKEASDSRKADSED